MGAGGGGMETPMMANNGGPGRGVTVHEMFHTYFPMYVRVNEKRFAWMDEGWADFNTSYVVQRYFEADTSLLVENFGGLSGTMGSLSDLPLITSTQFLDGSNYGYASYPLPAFIYSMLHQHLGEDLFRLCYRSYIERWAQRSPTPYDFFYTFEDVSGQDLSWLWAPWFFRYGDADVKVADFKRGKLTIANQGRRPVPVVVEVLYTDSSRWQRDYSAQIWSEESSLSLKIPNWKEIESIRVNQALPDAEILDNFYPDLREQYSMMAMPRGLLGTYDMNEYPVSVTLSEKNGLLYGVFFGREGYYLPTEDGAYRSLDGRYRLQVEDGNMVLEINGTEFRLTGSKQ